MRARLALPFSRLAVAAAAALLLPAFAGATATATPPTALTGPVTAVGATTATVTGTVNPNGVATTWSFEVGTTTAYGTKTAATSAGSGTASTGVSANLTGLTAGTTYHYRLDATSSAGTTLGTDGIFTTSAAPAALTAAATNLTATSAALNGTVNPNGQPTTYAFEYGKTTTYGTKTPATSAGSGTSPVAVTASVTGLQAGQTYHFRLDATSDAGTTDGPDMSFTAGTAAPTGAPTVTTKAASSVTPASARLNGTVNPNGQATTWYFDFGTTTSYGSTTPVANLGSGTKPVNVSATVNGLPAGIYHFRLVATNAAGTSFGSDLTFGSGGPPTVQTGSAQGAGPSTATLTGSVDPLGNATTWYFEYGTTTAYGVKTAAKSAGSGTEATGVSAAIAKLLAGTTYHYRLVATSSAGTSYGSDVTFMTVPAVTLSVSTSESVFGKYVTLSGIVASRQSGVKVTIEAEPFRSSAFAPVGTVLSIGGGSWTFAVKPALATAYEASTTDGSSPPTTVGVHPAVTLRVITKARFSTTVVASTSFAGKVVQLQRQLAGGSWVTVARSKLNARSAAIFPASALPHGASTVRIAMSINQAGPGFLAGFSRTLAYKRA